jgi:hypothetical protein
VNNLQHLFVLFTNFEVNDGYVYVEGRQDMDSHIHNEKTYMKKPEKADTL